MVNTNYIPKMFNTWLFVTQELTKWCTILLWSWQNFKRPAIAWGAQCTSFRFLWRHHWSTKFQVCVSATTPSSGWAAWHLGCEQHAAKSNRGECEFIYTCFCRPVTKGALKFFSPPLVKSVGHSLKIRAPLRKLFAPPGVPSWLRVCASV